MVLEVIIEMANDVKLFMKQPLFVRSFFLVIILQVYCKSEDLSINKYTEYFIVLYIEI